MWLKFLMSISCSLHLCFVALQHEACKCIALPLQILHISVSASTTICWECSSRKSISSFKYDMLCITCLCSIVRGVVFDLQCITCLTEFGVVYHRWHISPPGTYHLSCHGFKTVMERWTWNFQAICERNESNYFKVSSYQKQTL